TLPVRKRQEGAPACGGSWARFARYGRASGLDLDRHVVDQSDTSDTGGHEQSGWTSLRRRTEPGIGELQAINVQASGAVELGVGGFYDLMARSAGARPGEQRAREPERDLTLAGGEVPVSAGEREPVRVADGGHSDDPDRYVEIGHHGPDKRQLLVVLLTEER